MSSGRNIPDGQRRNKRTNLSLTPVARAVADEHPRAASRAASAGLAVWGAMSPKGRARWEEAAASDPAELAARVERLVLGVEEKST